MDAESVDHTPRERGAPLRNSPLVLPTPDLCRRDKKEVNPAEQVVCLNADAAGYHCRRGPHACASRATLTFVHHSVSFGSIGIAMSRLLGPGQKEKCLSIEYP